MTLKICDVSPAVLDKLPAKTDDKSGVGVHYVDAVLKPMNTTLEDGTVVKCKRRGLKITFAAGDKKGDGLMRRLAVGPDPQVMLVEALAEAGRAAGVDLALRDGAIYLTR